MKVDDKREHFLLTNRTINAKLIFFKSKNGNWFNALVKKLNLLKSTLSTEQFSIKHEQHQSTVHKHSFVVAWITLFL